MVLYLGNGVQYLKCKVLRIARIKSTLDRDYFLGEVKLERIHVEKDLGVLVSTNLTTSLLKLKECLIYLIEHVEI